MTGEGDRRFNPHGHITIAQEISSASRLHDFATDGHIDAITVTTGNKWYEGFVDYAISVGLIDKNDFKDSEMNRPATRGELAYIYGSVLPQSELLVLNQGVSFKEVNGSFEYSAEIIKLAEAGIIAGADENNFKPNNKITRAESAAIISRLIKPKLIDSSKVLAKPLIITIEYKLNFISSSYSFNARVVL